MFSLKERSFIINFHSDNEITVKACDALNTDLPIKIEKLLLKYNGEIIKKKKNVSVVRYQSKTSNFFSFGVLNEDNLPLRIILSFKESENLIFSGNRSHIEKIVQPRKYEFFLHLFYLNNDNNNEYDFDFNLEFYSVE